MNHQLPSCVSVVRKNNIPTMATVSNFPHLHHDSEHTNPFLNDQQQLQTYFTQQEDQEDHIHMNMMSNPFLDSDHQQLLTHSNDQHPSFTDVDGFNRMFTVEDSEEKMHQENNVEMTNLSADVLNLSQLFIDINELIAEQGDGIEHAHNHVEATEINLNEATETLRESQVMHTKLNIFGKFFELGAVVAGGTIGSIGWFGGPWIGIPTTVLGLGIGGSIAFVKKKLIG